MALVHVLASLLAASLALPAFAQTGSTIGARPVPEEVASRVSLPATGRTIGGPSGAKNVPVGAERDVMGFDGSIVTHRVDACMTVLNFGPGAANMVVRGATASSWIVPSQSTHVLCQPRMFNASIECLGDGLCNFEWRLDHAAVGEN